MALNNFKCNYLVPLHFRGLIKCMQVYKSVCAAVTICATLLLASRQTHRCPHAHTHTHTHTHTHAHTHTHTHTDSILISLYEKLCQLS